MKLCDSAECIGCLACVNSCPKNALIASTDEKGFIVPLLIKEKCIDCGICEKACPILKPTDRIPQEQYGFGAWSKADNIRKNSSSGGVFSELANAIIQEGGIVVGAAFNPEFKLYHTFVKNISDLEKLRGSKYLQSNINDTYQRTKSYLKEGKKVFFSGTPCQIAGLYGYLKKEYPNLITCDFICHGVPSPKVFQKYREWLENKYKSTLEQYHFRNKRKSWCWSNTKAVFKSGTTYIGTWFVDPFMRLFLRDNILRKSCYHCQFTNMNRVSDITIGDFWGYRATSKEDKNTDKGISLLLVNTSIGFELFNKIKSHIYFTERSIDIISKSQKSLSSSWDEPSTREEFWKDFDMLDFEAVIKKWGYPEKRDFSQYIISEWGLNPFTHFLSRAYNVVFHRLLRL